MQHLLHSVWRSIVVIGTLRPSLSSGRPYQCMCCSTMCLHCNHSSMVSCCFPCRLQILAFCPPPPTLIAVFISIYLFFYLLIHFFIHVFLYSAIWLLCDSAHWALGVGRFRLDCRLSRPIWCSSTSGCNCGFSPQVSQARSLHLRRQLSHFEKVLSLS